MVQVVPHLRASWGGSLGVPASEVWTNSMNLMGLTGPAMGTIDDGELQAALPKLAAAVRAWFEANGASNRGHSSISSAARLEWVKLNAIGADGKYLYNPHTFTYPTEIRGPGTATNIALGNIPWQQSSVISLRTAVARGRGSRGRIYPPVCGVAPDITGYMDTASADKMQLNAVTLIGDLNKIYTGDVTSPAREFNVAVVSAARAGKGPLVTPVTNVYVDTIPDVQRRRVNRLAPKHTAPTSVYINT